MDSPEAVDPPPFDMKALVDRLRDLEHEERFEVCVETFKQHPNRIALMLKAAHIGIPSPFRAFFGQVFEKILEDEEVPDSTLQEVCTSGLLDVLIDIALDARIYMWNKPASSFYYFWLGRFVISIYRLLDRCCIWLIEAVVGHEDCHCYSDIRLHQLPKTRKLWPLLWINRQLLEDNPENLITWPLSGEQFSPAVFRDLVVSCIWHMLTVHKRFIRKPEIPAWATGIEEIFLYSWRYMNPASTMHAVITATLAVHLRMRSTEEAKHIIAKVAVDVKNAFGIIYPLYYQLEQRYPTPESAPLVLNSLICLQNIIYFSSPSPILPNIAARDARFFRAVTSACQYSICSTEDSESRIACLQEGFLAILESGRVYFIKDPDSAAKLARIGSRILPTLSGRKHSELQEMIIEYFSLLSATIPALPRRTHNTFDRTIQRCWFSAWDDLKKSPQARGHRMKLIIERWKTIGIKLDISVYSDIRPSGHDEFPRLRDYRRACHWDGCLCNRGSFHRYLVCKGCWSVVYCNQTCQTMDWREGGHRESCSGRS